MTDKQIIIDGVDVSGCRYLFDDTSYKRSKTSCSITLKDCKYLGNNCYYKQLKAKEQECEKLRFPMKDNNYAILTKEEFENFNQLKKENKQLKQTLAEIKEIAENNKHSVLCFTAFEGDTIEVNNEPMATILQKINECEVDK